MELCWFSSYLVCLLGVQGGLFDVSDLLLAAFWDEEEEEEEGGVLPPPV